MGGRLGSISAESARRPGGGGRPNALAVSGRHPAKVDHQSAGSPHGRSIRSIPYMCRWCRPAAAPLFAMTNKRPAKHTADGSARAATAQHERSTPPRRRWTPDTDRDTDRTRTTYRTRTGHKQDMNTEQEMYRTLTGDPRLRDDQRLRFQSPGAQLQGW